MKANELRIGNWVRHEYIKDGNIEKQITANDILQLSKHPEVEIYYQPIELTEDRLEKFGFRDGYNGRWIISRDFENDAFILDKQKDGYWKWIGNDEKLYQYVHQLQNLNFGS